MSLTRFSTALMVLALLAGGGFVLCGAAQPTASESGLSAQVRLADGNTRKVTKVSGYITCKAYDGGSLKIPFEKINKLEIVKGGSDVTILLLGGESVLGKTEPFAVRGEGDWGSCEFMSTTIASVVFSNHPQKDRTEIKGMSAEVLMPKGGTKKIGGLQTWRRIECVDGDFSLELSLDKIKRLDAAEGGSEIKVLLTDGTVASGRTKPFSLEGQVAFGSVVFQCSEITSVAFSEHPQEQTNEKNGIELSIHSMGGSKIKGQITNLRLGYFDFTLDAKDIASLVFPVESNRVQVQTHDAKECTFTFGGPASEDHALAGQFAGGRFSIPYSKVTAMALVGSARRPANAVLSRSPDSPSGALSNIEDMMGNRVEASSVQTTIGFGSGKFDIFFPSTSFQGRNLEKGDLDVVYSDPVRYLLDGSTILQNGLQVANGSLSLSIGEQTILSKDIGQNDSTAISGKVAFGDFRISAHRVRSLSVSRKASEGEKLYVAADADAVVKTTKGKGLYIKSPILNAENTIRPGYYLVGGGRLYRLSSRELPVKTAGGESIMVRFDKIRLLTVEKSYAVNKKIRLVSQSGQELVGSIDLEAVAKSDNTTYLSDEGIVGRISPSFYVFVPFTAIASMRFGAE